MTTRRAHGLWLLLGAIAWGGATAAALPARAPAWAPGDAEEPLAPPSLWSRVGHRAQALLGRPRDAAEEITAALGVPAWHRAGDRGAGVTIAVLDSGFKGYRGALGKVLPAKVEVKSFRKDGRLEAKDSEHGILCAELLHRLAPDARLLFANWEPETPESFLDAVRWARARGARVISCSIIMPTWSDGEGGGAAHAALAKALGGEKDALFFASAGNTALRHWGGAFAPGKDGWHQWEKGRTENLLRPHGDDRVSVELAAGGGAVYEVVVRDRKDDREVGRSTTAVRFDPRPGHRYAVRLRRLSAGTGPQRPLHLTVLGGRLSVATAAGSVPFPGDGAAVVAVGAVDDRGRRQAYSSHGPNGTAAKPDLTATVPFPSRWRPEQPFAGTSAAAPQAAALAALVWSRHPDWSAKQVREALARAAKGNGGRARLPVAAP